MSIRALHDMWIQITRDMQFSKSRFIVQAHADFGRAFRDYEKSWAHVVEDSIADWEAEEIRTGRLVYATIDLLGEADEGASPPPEAAGSVEIHRQGGTTLRVGGSSIPN